jgi:ADP-ribosyl-[dinitrogen reductase] hydrolase
MPIKQYIGSLVGAASGDALGWAAFFNRENFTTTMDMPKASLTKPGDWTDDTSLALCLAASLLEKGFNAKDQIRRYAKWLYEGYMTSTGVTFDIGGTIAASINQYIITGRAYTTLIHPTRVGNGALMRLSPVPLYFANTPKQAIFYSGKSSKTTHGHPFSVHACRYFSGLIIGALQGKSKKLILSNSYSPVPNYWKSKPLPQEVKLIANGSYKTKTSLDIIPSGYVLHTLESALWAFYNSSSFEEGMLLAINLGGDSDSIGAVYGQLAGAYYGIQAIPEKWASTIAKKDLIIDFAKRLYFASFHK